MRMTIALSLLAACVSLAPVGCAATDDEELTATDGEEDGEDIGSVAQATGDEDDPPTGNNHFLPICHWASDVQKAYRIMGSGALNRGDGFLPSMSISLGCRHDALQNAVQCGLAQDQAVTDPVTGITYRGHWGLAPRWEGEALTASERRWVTGCMAQRLNAFGLPVTILLEGDTDVIHRHSALDSTYPWDESTVWGDLFSSTAPLGGSDGAPYQLYACTDGDLELACTGALTPEDSLDERVCDTSPHCGVVTLGPCSNPAVCTIGASTYPVCTSDEGTFTETVHVQLAGGVCVPPP